MKILAKRNQIILLNAICLALYTYVFYDNYKQHGTTTWQYATEGSSSTDDLSIIFNGVFILCLLSTVYQFLDRLIFNKMPNRFIILQLFLIISCGLFVVSCLCMGIVLIIGIIHNLSNLNILDPINFYGSLLSIFFFYLSFLIIEQLFYNRKKTFNSTHILDEKIE
jgi:hypothetical protein